MVMSEALSILQTAFLVLLKIAGPVLMIAFCFILCNSGYSCHTNSRTDIEFCSKITCDYRRTYYYREFYIEFPN